MKNIVLLDVYANYIESVLAIENVHISMAIVENQDLVNKCKDKFGNKIENYYYRIPATNEEFDELNKSDYNLTYEDIENFRATQLKCEHYLHREIMDYSNIQYRYYMALRFWLDFFNNNKIDMVFDGHIEHGAIWDSIPIDIAISKGIPVYSVALSSANGEEEICTLVKLNDKSFLNIKEINLKKMDLNSYLNNITQVFANLTEKKQKKITSFSLKELKRKTKNFRHYIKDKFLNPIKKYNKRNSEFIYWDNLSNAEQFEKSLFIKRLKRIYDHIATKPDFDKKYIYIPLHQEPEATIMATTKISNQIFIIKMLSEILPEDWKIYVKEHPSEFNVYKISPYFYRNIDYFRNPDDYYQIQKLKNVELINMETNSSELIKNSQAVCSITGTSLIQAMVINKPVIMFGQGLNFIENLKDVFKISSKKDLENAVLNITNGFKPNYSDLQNVSDNYAFVKNNYEIEMMKSKNEDFIKIFDFLSNKI